MFSGASTDYLVRLFQPDSLACQSELPYAHLSCASSHSATNQMIQNDIKWLRWIITQKVTNNLIKRCFDRFQQHSRTLIFKINQSLFVHYLLSWLSYWSYIVFGFKQTAKSHLWSCSFAPLLCQRGWHWSCCFWADRCRMIRVPCCQLSCVTPFQRRSWPLSNNKKYPLKLINHKKCMLEVLHDS
jgi:hypothetical protein